MKSRSSSSSKSLRIAALKNSATFLEKSKQNRSVVDFLVKKDVGGPEHGDGTLTSRAISAVHKSKFHGSSSCENVPDSSLGSRCLSNSSQRTSNISERNVGLLSHPENREYCVTNEAHSHHTKGSERSKELLQRANIFFERASLALGSSTHKMENTSSLQPKYQGRVLFSGAHDNLSISIMSPLNQSASGNRKLDPPASEPKVRSKDPPGSVSGSSATSTTGTMVSSEEEVQRNGIPFQSSYTNPYAHYRDPDVELSIMLAEDSFTTSSPSVPEKKAVPKFSNLNSGSDVISTQESPRPPRAYSTPNLEKGKDYWEAFDRASFQDIDGLGSSLQKCNPVLGEKQHCSAVWTTSPRKGNRGKHRPIQGHTTIIHRDARADTPTDHFEAEKLPMWHVRRYNGGLKRNGTRKDSLAYSTYVPPLPPRDTMGASNTLDIVVGRENDSISTLSAGSPVNRNRKASLRQEIPTRRVMPVQDNLHVGLHTTILLGTTPTIRHSVPYPIAPEEGPLTHRTPCTRASYSTQSPCPTSPLGLPHPRLGGPGGKYVVDEPMPTPSCCELFFWSCHSSKPGGNEYRFRSTQEMRSPAVFVGSLQKQTPTTVASPESVVDFPRSGPVVQERIFC